MRQFGDFTASELYCPKCKTARLVREKLLLILPSGQLHEYLCVGCGSSLGKRSVTGPSLAQVRPKARLPKPTTRGLLK